MDNARDIQVEAMNDNLKKIADEIKYLEEIYNEIGRVSNEFKIHLDALKGQYIRMANDIDNVKFSGEVVYNEEKVNNLNEKFDKNSNKISALEDEIQILESQRSCLTTISDRRMLDSRIQMKQEKLITLQKKEVKLGNRQRTMVISKLNKSMKRDRLLTKQMEKVSMTDQQIDDLENIKGTLDTENSLKDKVTNKIADIKGKFYEKKLEHQEEVLATLYEKNVGFKGANVMVVSKKATNRLRSKMSKVVSKVKSGLIKGIEVAQTKLSDLNDMLQDESTVQPLIPTVTK